MARQILPLIDLRTPDQKAGITKKMQTIQSIVGIMKLLGEAEQVRRERQTLDRISRAITGGATTMEAIMAAANQQPQMGTGLPGMLQKVGGQFMPQGGGIQQGIQKGILQNAMTRALTPKYGEPSGTFAPGTITQTAPTGKVDVLQRPLARGEPFERTKADKALKNDVDTLTKKDAKGKLTASLQQRAAARDRLRQNPSLRNIRPGQIDYTDVLKGKSKEKVGTFDKAYGKEAYDEALQEIKDTALAQGATEASAEADFNRWWDEQAASEDPKGFGRLVIPRSEFQGITAPNIPERTLMRTIEPKEILDKSIQRNPGESIEDYLKRARQ